MPRRIAQPNHPRGHVWQARVHVLGGAARRGRIVGHARPPGPGRRAGGASQLPAENCPPNPVGRDGSVRPCRRRCPPQGLSWSRDHRGVAAALENVV